MEAEQAVVVRETTSESLSLKQVTDRVNLVHEVLSKVMKKGTHFGTVPGCGDKMVLLKPGADVLAMTFRLVPEFQVETISLPNDHREYRVVCSMRSPDGVMLGQGVGSASTMERKYRYRWDGSGNQRRRVENEDIADVFNTVLKIAKKRAHIDATLTVTGAADLFTQDLIDEDDQRPTRAPVKMPTEAPPAAPPLAPSEERRGKFITQPQIKRLMSKAHDANVTMEALRLHVNGRGIQHMDAIPVAMYDAICAWVDAGGQESPPAGE